MQIPGARLRLRPWTLGDEASLVANADNRNVWRNLTDRFPHPYTHADAVRWIERVGAEDPPHNFAIVVDGAAVGGVGFERLPDLGRRTAEVGYWLGEPHWGRGLALEALRLLVPYTFGRFDFVRLQASVMDRNRRSARVLEKAGFRLEAKLHHNIVKDGQVLDSWLYALLRSDYDARAGS